MKWFEVKLYNGTSDPIKVYVVQSKFHRTAISNVLTNKYKGSEPITAVKCREVNLVPVDLEPFDPID